MEQFVKPFIKVSPLRLRGLFIQLITTPSVPSVPFSIFPPHSGHFTISSANHPLPAEVAVSVGS